MIFKNIDDKSEQIQLLKDLYSQSNSEAQKKLINLDLKKLQAGITAEKENAYYLDFEFEKSKHIILLHDIRLEHNGRTAQFDHILISRFGIELLESKSSTGVMSIKNDGSINIKTGSYTNTFPNPLEQSKRHATVLREFLKSNELLTKRIDILGGIEINSKVLINPKTTLTNNQLPNNFERADSFISKRKEEIDKTSILKIFSMISKAYHIDKAKEIAQLIVDSHKPINFDYAKKFKITKQVLKEDIKIEGNYNNEVLPEPKRCPRCKEGKLVKREIKSQKAKEKYGSDAFLGCSRYPKCRYSENIVS